MNLINNPIIYVEEANKQEKEDKKYLDLQYGLPVASTTVVEIHPEGEPVISFLQNIFPILLMTTLAVIVFCIPKIKLMTKIELTALFLISVVFFTQLSQITNDYITYFTAYDTVILSSYIIFLISIAINAMQIKNEKTEPNSDEAKYVKPKGRGIIMIAIGILFAISILGYVRF